MIKKLSTHFLLLSFVLSFHAVMAQEEMHQVPSKIRGYAKKKKANSSFFQGNKETKNYFEGWYFKMVSADSTAILSVIPGISMSEDGTEQHAFIQFINGKTSRTYYQRFAIEEFSFSEHKFAVWIGDNYFSEDSLVLNIQNDSIAVSGKVIMSDQVKLIKQNKQKQIGIMGWYRRVPFMECYHGVVSLDHELNGSLQLERETFNFEKGTGYIEKDWGKSMPSSWIWMQSNNFTSEGSSFMLSIAKIPWLGSSFTGFLGFFLHEGTAVRFGTYTHAKLSMDTSDLDHLKITIKNKKVTYFIETFRHNSGVLKAPVNGAMDRRISEGIDAQLKLTVTAKDGKVIFQDSTSVAGLELVGDMAELNKKSKKKKREK